MARNGVELAIEIMRSARTSIAERFAACCALMARNALLMPALRRIRLSPVVGVAGSMLVSGSMRWSMSPEDAKFLPNSQAHFLCSDKPVPFKSCVALLHYEFVKIP